MEAKNFRIGNFVDYKGTRRVYQIRRSGCDFHIGGNHFQSFIWDAIQSIQLTKKWVLDFGGEIIEDGFDSDEGGIVCVIDFEVFRLMWDAKHNYWKAYRRMTQEWQNLEDLYIAKINFVHEWQNLFFALTGRELELKTDV